MGAHIKQDGGCCCGFLYVGHDIYNSIASPCSPLTVQGDDCFASLRAIVERRFALTVLTSPSHAILSLSMLNNECPNAMRFKECYR